MHQGQRAGPLTAVPGDPALLPDQSSAQPGVFLDHENFGVALSDQSLRDHDAAAIGVRGAGPSSIPMSLANQAGRLPGTAGAGQPTLRGPAYSGEF